MDIVKFLAIPHLHLPVNCRAFLQSFVSGTCPETLPQRTQPLIDVIPFFSCFCRRRPSPPCFSRSGCTVHTAQVSSFLSTPPSVFTQTRHFLPLFCCLRPLPILLSPACSSIFHDFINRPAPFFCPAPTTVVVPSQQSQMFEPRLSP